MLIFSEKIKCFGLLMKKNYSLSGPYVQIQKKDDREARIKLFDLSQSRTNYLIRNKINIYF